MSNKINFRRPDSTDGYWIHQLVKLSPPLDTNSLYANLLQASHFSDTSICADMEGELVGFVSGYLHPKMKNTLFIWQVAVAEKARGKKVASRMIKELLEVQSSVRFIETSITKDNIASWRLFESLAHLLNAEIARSRLFEKDKHFMGTHETEYLVRIGPFGEKF